MEKIILSVVGAFIGYIIIRVIEASKVRKGKESVTTEKQYREFCKNAGFVYIANPTIRESLLGAGFVYTLANGEVKNTKPAVNIGFVCHDRNVLESVQQVLKVDAVEQMLFNQTYGTADFTFSGLAYPAITKDDLPELSAMADDHEFFQWLKSKKPYVIDGVTRLPIDADSIVNFAMPVHNFDISILEEIPGYKIETLIFGQGTVTIAKLDKYLPMFPNLNHLYFNYITIDNTSDEIIDFFVNYCNNSKIDKITLGISSELDPQLIESRLERNVTIDYQNMQ